MAGVSKREDAIKLRAKGLTFREIGHRLGVSRERARQLVTFPEAGPVGRPRIYSSDAERQRAYRQRRREEKPDGKARSQ